MHKKFNDLESVTEQISRAWILSALICQAPRLYSLKYLIGFFEKEKYFRVPKEEKSPPSLTEICLRFLNFYYAGIYYVSIILDFF